MIDTPTATRCLLMLLLSSIGGLVPATTLGATTDREQQLAEQLLAADPVGTPIWLEAPDGEFLALHYAASGALSRRAVLLVHQLGGHPDWPEVIAPLRTGLPNHGWSTLSLQMPLLPTSALANDYGGTVVAAGRRIESGIEYLQEQGYSRIVLLGYGFGASQALAWLASENSADGPVDGLISLGILAREFLQPTLDPTDLLASIEIPVLDLYGRNDFPEVIDTAEQRRRAVSHSVDFTQQAIAGANHYFTGAEEQLLNVVVAWLDQTFANRPDTVYDKQNASRADSKVAAGRYANAQSQATVAKQHRLTGEHDHARYRIHTVCAEQGRTHLGNVLSPQRLGRIHRSVR